MRASCCGRSSKLTSDRFEHRAKHGGRQPAGIRIVARAVIAIEQHATVAEVVAGTVSKGEQRLSLVQRRKRLFVCDTAERQDDLEPR